MRSKRTGTDKDDRRRIKRQILGAGEKQRDGGGRGDGQGVGGRGSEGQWVLAG